MTGDPFLEVQAGAMVRQADLVDHVADEVGRGRSAATSVTMGSDSYGLLCRLVPVLLDPLHEATIAALAEASDSLRRSADGLRATARGYAESDGRVRLRFGYPP
jgi:hypothetical protein